MTEAEAWGLPSKAVDEITVIELEGLCDEAFSMKEEVDELSKELDNKKEKLNLIQDKIESHLTFFGKKKWESKSGNIEVRERLSVRIPRTDEDKKELFGWLEGKGIFWQTVGVNSQTLNALYKAEFEAAASEGKDFKMPGIGDPQVFKTVVLKGKK